MIELINSVSQAFSITFLPILGILIRYHYTREREKNTTLTSQNEVMTQLVSKITQQSRDVDQLVRCVGKMDETQRLVLKGLTSDIITLGKNVEHLHVENKEKLIVVSDIAKHLILTESKVEDCKSGLTNLNNRFDMLK